MIRAFLLSPIGGLSVAMSFLAAGAAGAYACGLLVFWVGAMSVASTVLGAIVLCAVLASK